MSLPPQASDAEVLAAFPVGTRVRAWCTFTGCPADRKQSRGVAVARGTRGVVEAPPAKRKDPIFEDQQMMVLVRWDTGAKGEVHFGLLEPEP